MFFVTMIRWRHGVDANNLIALVLTDASSVITAATRLVAAKAKELTTHIISVDDLSTFAITMVGCWDMGAIITGAFNKVSDAGIKPDG